MTWQHIHIAALQSLGRSKLVQAARWNLLQGCLDDTLLSAYLNQLPAFVDVEAEQRAIAHALAYWSLTQSFCFLISWPSALNQTAELVLNRCSELDGSHLRPAQQSQRTFGAKSTATRPIWLRSPVAMAAIAASGSRCRSWCCHRQIDP